MTLKTTARLALVLVLSATVMTACGRKGDLDVPGTAAADQNNANKKAAPVEDRPFVLDPLL